MNILKRVFIAFTLLQFYPVFAQWHQLSGVTSYDPGFAYAIGPFGQTAVKPVANGKIFHARFIKYGGVHSGRNDLYVSYDDLRNNQCVICPMVVSSYSSGERVFDISSANDSIASVCYEEMGAIRVRYTFNNFNTKFYANLPGSARLYSQCMTYRHLYIAYTYYGQDSLIIRRASGTPTTAVIKLPAYQSLTISDSKPQRLSFVNDSTGYLLVKSRANSSKTIIIKTMDYGQTWNEIAVDSINPIKAYCFVSTATGYLIKNNGTIHKTSNGGINWNQITSPNAGSLTCISFYDGEYGYVGGNNGSLWRTTDGGNSWSSEQGLGSKPILDIYTFPYGVAYCVNSDHVVFKNQEDVTGLNEVNLLAGTTIYPNPASNEITIDLWPLKQSIKNIKLVSMLGEIVYYCDVNNAPDLLRIPVDKLQTGSYFIILQSDYSVIRKKMIISR